MVRIAPVLAFISMSAVLVSGLSVPIKRTDSDFIACVTAIGTGFHDMTNAANKFYPKAGFDEALAIHYAGVAVVNTVNRCEATALVTAPLSDAAFTSAIAAVDNDIALLRGTFDALVGIKPGLEKLVDVVRHVREGVEYLDHAIDNFGDAFYKISPAGRVQELHSRGLVVADIIDEILNAFS